MSHLEAVQPGETLPQQVERRMTSAVPQGRYAPGAHRSLTVRSRRSLSEHRAILSAMVDRDVDRAEPLLRQHIARSAARLAAAGSPG